MCFSTTASFVAGSLLTVIGIAAIKKTKSRSRLLFASIPIIFAIQQFSEGFVWIVLENSTDRVLHQIFINCFLLFALVIWPGWVSTAIYLIEKKGRRKKILGAIALSGIVLSALSMYYLIFYTSQAWITDYHIHYQLNIPYGDKLLGILYLIPTVISHFVSSNKRVNIMGVLVLLSYFVTVLLFDDNVLSIWCFFSAIISMMIYYIIAGMSIHPGKN